MTNRRVWSGECQIDARIVPPRFCLSAFVARGQCLRFTVDGREYGGTSVYTITEQRIRPPTWDGCIRRSGVTGDRRRAVTRSAGPTA